MMSRILLNYQINVQPCIFLNLGAWRHFEGLNIYKSQLDQNLWCTSQKFLTRVFFKLWSEKKTKKNKNLSFKNGHFLTISCHIFLCLKMHHFMGEKTKVSFDPPAVIFSNGSKLSFHFYNRQIFLVLFLM